MKIEHKIIAAFAVSVIAVVAISGAMWKSARDAQESAEWVAHTNKVLDNIAEIEAQIHRIESSTRGYIISGKSDRLEDRDAAVARLDAALQTTRRLVADNPVQLERLDGLAASITARMEVFERVAKTRELKGYVAAQGEIIRIPLIEKLEAGPIQRLQVLKQAEQNLLLERSDERQQIREREQLVSGLAALMLVVFLLFSSVLIRRQISESRISGEIIQKTSMERKAILEAAEVAIISCDLNGLITSFSPAAEKMLGYAADEVIGRHTPCIFHDPAEVDRASRSLAERLGKPVNPGMDVFFVTAKQKGFNSEEWTYIRKDGSRLTVQLSISSLRTNNGDIFGYLGAATDISRRKRIEQELVEAKNAAEVANRAKDAFLATMSHEIRTPLSAMLGMLELLGLTKLDEQQKKELELARESGLGLVRIIDDILDSAKMAEGKMQIVPERMSIRQVLDRLFNMYSALASKKNLLFRRHIDSRISDCLMGDSLRILQILGNFVSNSIKFTDKGGIEVRAELADSTVTHQTIEFAVIDTGIGISAEAVKRLFQPFEQATAETTRLFGGTGLGLSISRQLAEMMGGSVSASSTPGEGALMKLRLTLPVADAGATAAAVEIGAEVDDEDFRGFSGVSPVLIVDDHSTNLLVLEKQIGALGLAVVAKSNGREALEAWESGEFSMIITDCNMPVMDGYELSRVIRDRERRRGLARTPIVAYTANVMPDGRLQAGDAGMDDFLLKPAEIKSLNRLLKKWLVRQGAMDGSNRNTWQEVNEPQPCAVSAALSKISDDPAERSEILDDFASSTKSDLEKIVQAILSRDVRTVELMAHRLKGSSRMIGGDELAEVCEALERAASSGGGISLEAFLPSLKHASAALDTAIRNYRL